MKNFLVMLGILLVITLSKLAYATPITYVADGYVAYWENEQYEYVALQGSVIIDDEIITVDDSEAPDHVFYKYHILDFEIFTELDHWAGEGFLHYETDGPKAVSMDDIHPFKDESSFVFKGDNGEAYDSSNIESWLTLAPQISLFMEDLLSEDGYSPRFTNVTLCEALPVPEPSTLLFMVMGTTLIVCIKRKGNIIFF